MHVHIFEKKSTRFHLDHWLSLPFHIDIGPAVMWVTFGADWGGMEPGSAPRPPAVSGTSDTPTGCGVSLTCQLCSAESPHPKQIQQIKHSIEFTLTSVFFKIITVQIWYMHVDTCTVSWLLYPTNTL